MIQANFFNECVILHAFLIAWQARSPQLNPHHFCLWDFLKDHVFQGCVTNEADLKASIVCCVFLIPTDIFYMAIDNMVV